MIKNKKGFTLIELLIVIGIIALLAGIALVALNPARQFALTRNATRTTHITQILSAIGQNVAANRGLFICADAIPVEPAAAETIGSTAASQANLGPCLSPTYLPSLPFDSAVTGAHWTSTTDYDTGYTVQQASVANGSRITVFAPGAELGEVISITR